MHRNALLVASCMMVLGCDPTERPEQVARETPVSARPLEGVLGGTRFVAKSARAKRAHGSKRNVRIFDVDAPCGQPAATDRYVEIELPWAPNSTRELTLELNGPNGILNPRDTTQSAVLHYKDDKGTEIAARSFVGRAEILEAPTEAHAIGEIRLRAIVNDDSVEGAVDVVMCD